MRLPRSLAWIPVAVVVIMMGSAHAGNVRLTLPKRSKPTPVQQLNRDGVKAVQKQQYEKAKKLFYKAYLLDPDDPFTLNNLGYISELEGESDRAARYYDLAGQYGSDALVDESNNAALKGKPVSQVAGSAEDTGMQLNRINVQAINLLRRDRTPEADLLLQQALKLDPKNAFTLNNMGFAKEKEGELESALGYYLKADSLHSEERVVIAVNSNWQGKGISAVAAENARKLREVMAREQSLPARVARLNLQGVSAMNRNDRRLARQYFEQAYKLDPAGSFTLNNMGFLAEMDGDRETADFYYDKAQEANRHKATVTVATRQEAEGKPVGQVAEVSGAEVQARMQSDLEMKRRQGGEATLLNRDGTPVIWRAPEPPKPNPEPGTSVEEMRPVPQTAPPLPPAVPQSLPPEYDIPLPK
jgi:Flp pilus assembly protein TadD